MAIRTLTVLILIVAVTGCRYDLDVTGAFYTPVPVNERFALSETWMKENEAREVIADPGGYTFLVGSDSHVGGTLNLNALLERAMDENTAAAAIAGDLCTGWEDDYDIAASVIEGAVDLPVFVTPGNHDLYFSGWNSFWDHFGPGTYTVEVHSGDTSDLFIFLDSGGGTLGSRQLEWLKVLLEQQRTDHRHAVVITHVNFFRNRFTTSTNIHNEEVMVLLDLFAKHRINVVIQGHDHKRYEEVIGATTYLTLDALKDENPDASFLELSVTAEGIDHRFVSFN